MSEKERRELLQKVTEVLDYDTTKTTKELAKELSEKKHEINSILYAAQNVGLVERVVEKDPKTGKDGAPEWKLTFSDQLILGKKSAEDSE